MKFTTANNELVYLDNAATTFPKPKSVIRAVNECISFYCGNPGRSGHKLSLACAEKIFECRELLCSLFSYPYPERICFTQNATLALNTAIKGLIKEPCHVIISDLEHNSVIRPLYKRTKELGGEYTIFSTDGSIEENIIKEIRPNTKFIISTLQSNVTGSLIDLKMLSDIAKRYNLGLIIDASQYVGHFDLDLSDMYFDAVCMPGHKALFGIAGSGVLILGKKRFDTLYEGGSGSESYNKLMPQEPPERYEAGTVCTPAIVSLLSGVQFIESYGLSEIESKIHSLTDRVNEVLSSMPYIKIYGANNGIISFNYQGYTSEYIAQRLNEYGICVRAGIHCAPLIHKRLGTENTGLVRVSFSVFNNFSQIERLYLALKSI